MANVGDKLKIEFEDLKDATNDIHKFVIEVFKILKRI